MTTLATMKARIETEIRRDDLTSEIADAISSAIAAYGTRPQYFSEDRSNTFNTVASQSAYTSSDTGCSFFSRLLKINYAYVLIGGQPSRLGPVPMTVVEDANIGSDLSPAQPQHYAWYGRTFHLTPVPNAVYSIRIGALLAVAEPASDGETGNVWMGELERLIRSRAKAELYAHVIKDQDKAQTFFDLAAEAWKQTEEKSEALMMIGSGRVVPFDI